MGKHSDAGQVVTTHTARVVMFSGGIGSWAAARRTADAYGVDGLTLLFADTRIEDSDLYRFLDDAAADIGAPLVKIADGRNPWDVFQDRRMLGNTRIAPCSTELKQKPARDWMAKHAPGATVVIGIDWTEVHRLEGARRGWHPWPVEAPLCERPFMTRAEIMASLASCGIRPPALYVEGFPHNNCGGGCVRAGAAHFAHLYRRRPTTFAEWEQGEERIRQYLGRDVSILRDRTGGAVSAFTLADLRVRLERQPTFGNDAEWGGCGCFIENETDSEP